MVTKLLEKAFDEASKLPTEEQEAIAALILEEIRSEHQWDKAFADSKDELARLADEALAEHWLGSAHMMGTRD